MNKIKLDKYVVMPAAKLPTNKLVRYWDVLLECDLIGDRFPDVDKCSKQVWREYWHIITQLTQEMHYVVDTESLDIVAEFTISEIFGKAGLIHFSCSPLITPQSALHICRTTTDQILKDWRDSKYIEEPFIQSIVGLTPVVNERACKFIQRVGFKQQVVVPFGAIYNNEICDALLTVKTL